MTRSISVLDCCMAYPQLPGPASCGERHRKRGSSVPRSGIKKSWRKTQLWLAHSAGYRQPRAFNINEYIREATSESVARSFTRADACRTASFIKISLLYWAVVSEYSYRKCQAVQSLSESILMVSHWLKATRTRSTIRLAMSWSSRKRPEAMSWVIQRIHKDLESGSWDTD